MAASERIDGQPEILDAHASSGKILAKAVRLLTKIPFARHVIAMVYALRDPAVPTSTKAMLAGALLYFLSPIDLIPDFIAGIGYLDDAAVVTSALKAAQTMITDAHYEAADAYIAKVQRA